MDYEAEVSDITRYGKGDMDALDRAMAAVRHYNDGTLDRPLERLDRISAELRGRIASGEATNVEKYLYNKVEEKIGVYYMAFCLFNCTRSEFRETACICLSDVEHKNYETLGAAKTLYGVMMTPEGMAEESEVREYIEEIAYILRDELGL